MKFKSLSLHVAMTLLVSFSLFSLSSCKKVKGCNDRLATNYDADADENDGSCIYKLDKFEGSYLMSENCDTLSYSYAVTITAGSETNTILIDNFAELALEITATVTGYDISINDTEGGYTFKGSGRLNGDDITFNYTTTANGTSLSCAAEGSRL